MKTPKKIFEVIEIIEQSREVKDVLKGCPYEILKEFVVVRKTQGEFLLKQGNIYPKIYIVADGIVGVYVTAEDGRKYSLSEYSKGRLIGEHEIFDLKPFSSNVEATFDVVLLELARDLFLKWLAVDLNINNIIARSLCNQIYAMTTKAGKDALYPLRQRICQYIASAPAKSGKIALDKNHLSEVMGVTTRSVSRVLKDLNEQGLILIERKSLVICDMETIAFEAEIGNT